MSNREDIREVIAAVSHSIWASWMDWLFEICPEDYGMRHSIPHETAERWKRQIATRYEDLSEREKDLDRKEADKILDAILAYQCERSLQAKDE